MHRDGKRALLSHLTVSWKESEPGTGNRFSRMGTGDEDMDGSLLIILNPVAGKGRGRVFRNKLPGLLGRTRHEIWETTSPGHATELAREARAAGYGAVVAAGGDGTMGEVVQVLAQTDTPLGLIPLGTGNDLARTLGIPLDPVRAARALLDSEVRVIDIGRERDASFAIVAGLGFPATVMHYANTHQQIVRGPLAIAMAVIRTVGTLQAFPAAVEVDGKSYNGSMTGIFVLNTRFTGGGLMIAPQADETDGLLDVVLMREISRLDLCRTLPKVYRGRHVGHPALTFLRGRRVFASTSSPVHKVFDGNVLGSAPLEAQIIPGGLRVLVPRVGSACC